MYIPVYIDIIIYNYYKTIENYVMRHGWRDGRGSGHWASKE